MLKAENFKLKTALAATEDSSVKALHTLNSRFEEWAKRQHKVLLTLVTSLLTLTGDDKAAKAKVAQSLHTMMEENAVGSASWRSLAGEVMDVDEERAGGDSRAQAGKSGRSRTFAARSTSSDDSELGTRGRKRAKAAADANGSERCHSRPD